MTVKKDKKIIKTISAEIKHEIIEKHRKGVKTSDVVNEYGLPQSTISTITQQKEKFKAINVKYASTRIFKGREMIVEIGMNSYGVDSESKCKAYL